MQVAIKGVGPWGCFRSNNGWANRYANQLGADGYEPHLVNRACADALFEHITQQQTLPPVALGYTWVEGDYTNDQPGLVALLEAEHPCPDPFPGETVTFAPEAQGIPASLTKPTCC